MNKELFDNLRKLAKTPESFWPQLNVEKDKANDTNKTPYAGHSILDPVPGTPHPIQGNVFTHAPSDCTKSLNSQISNQMINNAKRKVITKTIDVAISSTAATREYTLDYKGYSKIIGYYIVYSSLGGLSSTGWKAGLSDGTRTILDLTTLDHFLATTGVAPKDRWHAEAEIGLPASKLVVSMANNATLGSAASFDVIAVLEE